ALELTPRAVLRGADGGNGGVVTTDVAFGGDDALPEFSLPLDSIAKMSSSVVPPLRNGEGVRGSGLHGEDRNGGGQEVRTGTERRSGGGPEPETRAMH